MARNPREAVGMPSLDQVRATPGVAVPASGVPSGHCSQGQQRGRAPVLGATSSRVGAAWVGLVWCSSGLYFEASKEKHRIHARSCSGHVSEAGFLL